MSLLIETRRAYRRLMHQLRHYRFVKFEPVLQRRKLEGYVDGITEVIDCAPLTSNLFLLFVYYEPQENMSNSSQRVLSALRAAGVNTVVLCNHELSASQQQFMGSTVHSVVSRDNQGFDFGAWKDGVKHLTSSGLTIERLGFLNDSVFFASTGLDEFVARLMLGEEDVVAAYENWGEDHHLQSFALSVSSHVVGSTAFTEFWNNYLPLGHRVHAIENGEKELTRAILASARTTRVLFNASDLAAALLKGDSESRDSFLVYPQPWRSSIEALGRGGADHEHFVSKTVELVNSTSTIHSGAYFMPKYLRSPLFKKDLVYRKRFEFWEVELWLPDLMPADEAEEFLTMLRAKRDRSALSQRDRRRFDHGVK